jgi:hypothetical protein
MLPDVTGQKMAIRAGIASLLERLFQHKKAMAKAFNDAYFANLH